MPNMLFANNANTTLNGGITAVATSMVVTSATGFPVPTGSQYFYCTLADAATQTTIEIVKVTAVSGTTFTIVRGQDGTTGTIFASGAVVSLRLVSASLNDFPKLDEANTFTQAQTFSALTSGRIPYSTTGGLQTDSANLTFNGTNLGVGTGTTYANLHVQGANLGTVLKVSSADQISGYIALGDGSSANNYNGIYRGAVNSVSSGGNYLNIDGYSGISFAVGTAVFGSKTQAALFDSNLNFLVGGTSNAAGARVLSENASGNQLGYRYTGIATWYISCDSSGNSTWNKDGSEKMRLATSGDLLVGTTSTIQGSFIAFQFAGTSRNGLVLNNTDTGTSNQFSQILARNGSVVGSITTTNALTAFNVTSDQRLKTDLGVVSNTTVIDETIIHDFIWKNGTKDRGVFAQEAYKIKPSAVTVGKDKEDGTIEIPWQVDYSKYIPDLIVKCQQLQLEVNQLKSKVGL